MPLDMLTAASLTSTALAAMEATFAISGHSPSPSQWAAIRDLLEHLQRAADGNLAPAVYLSAIPAGTGKSQSIAAFARALMDDPRYAGTGMLIACNRVSEVDDMASDLLHHRDQLHVRVGQANPVTLSRGAHTTADGAQLVIATQEALRRALRDTSDFGQASHLHYLGRRRAVVAWDEAIAFNRPVLLDGGRLGALADRVQSLPGTEAAYAALLKWMGHLSTVSPGPCAVPDFASMGLDFAKLEDAADADDDVAMQARALGLLSGGTGYTVVENTRTRRMVTHFPELPHTLMPVIVTDASAAKGVHRERYEQMATKSPVQWLKNAEKTYGNMTIRILPTAASRSTYKARGSDKARALIDMAVRYIRSDPSEVLVISYKRPFNMKGVRERTIAAAIEARLTPEERERVRHITWGQHTATNAHKDVRRVLLMGLNFLPRTAAIASSAAVQALPMTTNDPHDHPTPAQVDSIWGGMLRDATLQGLLRGHARMGAAGDCGPMEAVILQTAQTGLSHDEYRAMFPEVHIVVDRDLFPVKPLRGRALELAMAIGRRLSAGAKEIPNPRLYQELGMDRQDYAALLKRPEVVDWLDSQGLIMRTLRGRQVGLYTRPM